MSEKLALQQVGRQSRTIYGYKLPVGTPQSVYCLCRQLFARTSFAHYQNRITLAGGNKSDHTQRFDKRSAAAGHRNSSGMFVNEERTWAFVGAATFMPILYALCDLPEPATIPACLHIIVCPGLHELGGRRGVILDAANHYDRDISWIFIGLIEEFPDVTWSEAVIKDSQLWIYCLDNIQSFCKVVCHEDFLADLLSQLLQFSLLAYYNNPA
jgi:hypothetical protein